MKGKNVSLWILSIFFLIWALAGLATTWAAIFFLIPAALFNPLAAGFLKSKYHFKSRWWISLCAVLIPVIAFSAGAPTTSSPVSAPESQPPASSAVVSSTAEESSSAISSSALKSSAPASATPAAASPTFGTKLKVHYIDVGQGDSEFLELPNGQTMLIDAGNPENGQQIVGYIKNLGHSKVDYLVATHPHADHIGGMAAVINNLDIGSFYAPKVTTTTQTYKGLIYALQSKKLGIHVAKAGTNMFKTGNLLADIIAPVNISGDDLNQYSAVIMLTYGDNRFLFTGDAGEPSESQITADVKADVLKVGHHGSSTSTSQAFLNKVKPKYAVIEVGAGNSYGHPTAATLSKLQTIGATIYRTDKDGTIIFTSDSHTITVDKKASSAKENAPPKASSKAATVKSTVPKATSPSTDNQSVTVYITDTGSKYHRTGCKYLKKSKHAISLKDAKAQGYGPCSICNPPQ